MWWKKRPQPVPVSQQALRSSDFAQKILTICLKNDIDLQLEEIKSYKYYDDVHISFVDSFNLDKLIKLEDEFEYRIKKNIKVIYDDFIIKIRVYKMSFKDKYNFKPWRDDTSDDLKVCLGISPEGPIYINMTTTHANLVIAGRPGSGRISFARR